MVTRYSVIMGHARMHGQGCALTQRGHLSSDESYARQERMACSLGGTLGHFSRPMSLCDEVVQTSECIQLSMGKLLEDGDLLYIDKGTL